MMLDSERPQSPIGSDRPVLPVEQRAWEHAERTLRGLGADHFEILVSHSQEIDIVVQDGRIKNLNRANDLSLAVRILRDHRMGFSFTTALSPPNIEAAIHNAWDIASIMPAQDWLRLPIFLPGLEKPMHWDDQRYWDEEGLALPLSHKIDLTLQMEADCRQTDARIQALESATLHEEQTRVTLWDRQGAHQSYRRTHYHASVICKAQDSGQDPQLGSESTYCPRLADLQTRAVGPQAAHWATERLGAILGPTFLGPAVLRNSVVAELLEFLGESFSAEAINKGQSMLVGANGKNIAAKGVSLISDGFLVDGQATLPFDAEGVFPRSLTLVDEGVFREAFYDSFQAQKQGCAPSGTAVRGSKSPPRVGRGNFFLRPGKLSIEELLAPIDRGILISELMGIHTANPITGDFSLGAGGRLIERGKLGKPVRGIAVAGNILGLLQKVESVGGDLKFFGSVGAPSVRLQELSIGGT